jgi:nicotinate-nucleotide adenylyltransferase
LIGFFGGSFDPFHLGHLHAAEILLGTFNFTKLYFVPAFQNPLKEKASADNLARLEMLKAGLEESAEKRFAVLDWEIKRNEKSYTIETVQRLADQEKEEIALILGNEVFERFSEWREPLRILALANVIVVVRNPTDTGFIPPVLQKIGLKNFLDAGNQRFLHSNKSRWIQLKSVSALPFTATAIREEIRKLWKESHIPPLPQGIQRSVWQVIKEKHLYAVN